MGRPGTSGGGGGSFGGHSSGRSSGGHRIGGGSRPGMSNTSSNRSYDWNTFRFIDLFAGIGGIRLGFEHVGGKCVFSSEFDEDACKTYEANFGEHPSGDITKIDAKDIPDFDILLGGKGKC